MANKWWEANIDPDVAEALVELRVTLSNKVVTRDFRPDVSINYDTLEDDLETMPSVFAFWSAILSEQKKKTKVLEIKIALKRSKFLTELSKSLREGAKLTKDDKDNLINVDPEYVELVTEHIKAECTLSKIFGIVDSLRMKSDHLRSLAGFKRAELSGS